MIASSCLRAQVTAFPVFFLTGDADPQRFVGATTDLWRGARSVASCAGARCHGVTRSKNGVFREFPRCAGIFLWDVVVALEPSSA